MFGFNDGSFQPGRYLTRAQAVTILVRAHLLDFEQGRGTLPPGMDSFDAFTDVNERHWFYSYVAWAYDAGLVQGAGGRFRPGDPITRQEFAIIVVRAGLQPLYTEMPVFNDADAISRWAMAYINAAYQANLMTGDHEGNFRPRDYITRAEAATVMNRFMGRIDSQVALDAAEVENIDAARLFTDVETTAWYFPSVLFASNYHFMSRDEDYNIVWIRFEE